MNREIKFRAWDKERKEMVYRFFSIDNTSGRCYNSDEPMKDLPYDIMQFTGLKDKNGKEIYEGDILNVSEKNKAEKVYRMMEVKFENHHIGDFHNWEIHGFRDYSKSTYGFEVEVVGNIMENPDLLSD